jgi:glutamyl-tRNA reductase
VIRLVLVGTSHHHAPVELREQVALDREDAHALSARLAEAGREAACLSTCNRTEVYVAAADAEQAELDAVAALASLEPDVEQALYRLHDRAAAHHLFRVAAGLDSLVPGEGEILGQVRFAHEVGTRPRSARALLRCRRPPLRSRTRCSAASRGVRSSSSARAR